MTPIAVITGASSGIGAATAIALGRHGYRVVVGARRIERLERVAGEEGLALRLDVTDKQSVNEFVGEVARRFGRVDVLVNNAGGALGMSPIEKALDEERIGMWKTNVLGLMWVTRACLPLLRKARHGHIVNIGSIAGFETYKGGAGYTAVKHAVRAITKRADSNHRDRARTRGDGVQPGSLPWGPQSGEGGLRRIEAAIG